MDGSWDYWKDPRVTCRILWGELTYVATLGTMDDSIRLACVLMKGKKKGGKSHGLEYECCVTNAQARW